MRLPLTGLSGCGLLRVFRAACRLSPISCVCSFAVPLFFLYLFLCRFSVCIFFPCMCPYWFLPVPLVLLAFFLCPTPGCRAYRDPDVMQYPSVSPCFLSAFRCFLFARMRIYYNVSLLPDFPSSLKNMFFNIFVNQRFIKMFKRNAKKSPDIFGLYVIKSYFCTRFREREQRCFDILTGTA